MMNKFNDESLMEDRASKNAPCISNFLNQELPIKKKHIKYTNMASGSINKIDEIENINEDISVLVFDIEEEGNDDSSNMNEINIDDKEKDEEVVTLEVKKEKIEASKNKTKPTSARVSTRKKKPTNKSKACSKK